MSYHSLSNAPFIHSSSSRQHLSSAGVENTSIYQASTCTVSRSRMIQPCRYGVPRFPLSALKRRYILIHVISYDIYSVTMVK